MFYYLFSIEFDRLSPLIEFPRPTEFVRFPKGLIEWVKIRSFCIVSCILYATYIPFDVSFLFCVDDVSFMLSEQLKWHGGWVHCECISSPWILKLKTLIESPVLLGANTQFFYCAHDCSLTFFIHRWKSGCDASFC